MKNIASVQNMRDSDAFACQNITPSRELMARAGEAIFKSASWNAPVAVVCGSGNNGGDGYVVAALLFQAGIPCRIFLFKNKFSTDGEFYFGRCRELGIPYEFISEATDFSEYNTILDCLLGTGFHGTVTPMMADLMVKINRSGAFVISADINSGLNGDSGMASCAVHSDLTVSLGDFKPGHFLGMAKDYIGKAINCPIGISLLEPPYYLIEEGDVRTVFPERKNFSNKGDFGYLALIGGSLKYSGAIRLANLAAAAMRSGAGVVKIAAPASICPAIIPSILESTLFPLSDSRGEFIFREEEFAQLLQGTRTTAFGMGIGNSEETQKALDYLLKNYSGTLLIDADGLNALSQMNSAIFASALPRLVFTPHPKEFSRLCEKSVGEILNDPIPLAVDYARSHHLILLLKGSSTIITDGQEVFISAAGCPGMATAGSGDVLSGITAALCASHTGSLLKAVAAAAWINGKAGELAQMENGPVSMIASDTVRHVRNVILSLSEDSGLSDWETPPFVLVSKQ